MNQYKELFADPPLPYRPLQIIHSFSEQRCTLDAFSYCKADDLETLLALGLGGIVCNVAFEDYLCSERHWKTFLDGVRRAADLGMTIWLYDEEGYPSGAAGGLVLEGEPELESRGLVCLSAPARRSRPVEFALPHGAELIAAFAYPTESGAVNLGGARPMLGLRWRPESGEWLCVALCVTPMYEGTHCTTNLYKKRRHPNILDPRATQKFLAVTHEQYRKRCGDLWPKVEAVFTDEPSLMTAYIQDSSDKLPAVPWSADLPDVFREKTGYELLPVALALFHDLPESARIRHDFYATISQLCSERYFGQIRTWCEEAGIASTGHPLWEETLTHHVGFEGSIFAALRMMDIPGLDRLSVDVDGIIASRAFTAEKFASSAAHLIGAERVMSETSDYSERSRSVPIALGDRLGIAGLQFSLGVNTITSYFQWRLEEEPARDYRAYNDYCARLALLLRGGVHQADVAVYYPIESVWSAFRPSSKRISADTQPLSIQRTEASFRDLSKWLLENQADYDYLDAEAISRAEVVGDRLLVGDESYKTVIVPAADVISSDTAEKLWHFGQRGQVVFVAPPRSDEKGRSCKGLFEFSSDGFALAPNEESVIRAVRDVSPPDANLFPPSFHIFVLHRTQSYGEVYMLFNSSAEVWTGEVALRAGKPGLLLDPETGEIASPGAEIRLGPRRAVLLVVER